MNVFQKIAAAISGCASGESVDQLLVIQIASKARGFESRISAAIRGGSRYKSHRYSPAESPQDAIVLEVQGAIQIAMCRLSASDRESLVYWVLQEAAARNSIERMASQARQTAC